MMVNPLGVAGSPAVGREVQVGESRTFPIRQWNDGKLGDQIDVITVYRTSREFTHDRCDAHNDRLARNGSSLRWMVDASGQMRIAGR